MTESSEQTLISYSIYEWYEERKNAKGCTNKFLEAALVGLQMAVYNRWTGTVDWTSGLDYWTHRFVSKAH